MLDDFLNNNSMGARLVRTIAEGVLSVVVVNIAIIVAGANVSPEVASILTAAIVAVLSPVISMLRTGSPESGE